MNQNDKREFLDLMKSACAVYGKPANEAGNLAGIYWGVLEEYPMEAVQHAFRKHLKDSERGQFFPKPADLIRFIEGSDISTDQIISAARLAKTPLGILCRIHIGHFDLEHNSDMFYLRQRAEECLQLLPEWKERARTGNYSDHEISIMLKRGVNPTAPMHDGLPAPANAPLLAKRAEAVSQGGSHLKQLEAPQEYDEEEKFEAAGNVREFIKDLMH